MTLDIKKCTNSINKWNISNRALYANPSSSLDQASTNFHHCIENITDDISAIVLDLNDWVHILIKIHQWNMKDLIKTTSWYLKDILTLCSSHLMIQSFSQSSLSSMIFLIRLQYHRSARTCIPRAYLFCPGIKWWCSDEWTDIVLLISSSRYLLSSRSAKILHLSRSPKILDLWKSPSSEFPDTTKKKVAV